ncbi:efflux RND transporter permease subunit [Lichenibacterium dinghuense]|uniref:efflux RND transporter permease subunit n=1 Tax=Lichenibacterium dinghuense TaxID=2895977 RepID=UPI001F214765|nr:efflux RND transporter permease subunit [Lichenibacterium sp. 6Y81]
MSLPISAWSIRRPMPALVGFAVLVILGFVAFRALPVTRLPNIDIPIVQIAITQSGAAPAELETQVTKKVEDAVAGVPGIWHILSKVSDGASTTTIQFDIGTPVDRALNDVKDQISKIRAQLPRTIDEPIVQRFDVEGLPIVTYAVSSNDRTTEQVSWFVDDTVARELQTIRGVGQVTRSGGVDREIRVSLNPNKLLALGVTAASVSAQLRATNVDLAGGRGEIAGQEQAIRTLAGTRTVQDLAALPIVIGGGRHARLDELGTVTDDAAEPRSFASLDGRPVVSFGVTRAKGASDAEVAQKVAARIAALVAAHPAYAITRVDNQVDYTVGNYHSAMESLVEGAVLAIVVVLVFLRDIRATIVAGIALPLSAIPTFWLMGMLGFSLNAVSLLAITLVTGILVDDAIVEIENIVRHMRMGKSAYRASLEAADEIGLAVIAISMTIVAVFAPVSFMGGIPGQYFKQFGLTVAIAVFFSLIVARLVTPVVAAYFLRPHGSGMVAEGRILRSYSALVRWSVDHRWVTLGAGLALFALSLWSTTLLPSGLIPAEDTGRSLLAIELPPGSRLADTEAVTRSITEKIRTIPEVESVLVYGGQVLGDSAEVRKATLVIRLSHKSKRTIGQKAIQDEITRDVETVPDIRFWFLKDNGQRDLQLTLAGADIAQIDDTANQLASEMRTVPILVNPRSTADLDRPELEIVPKSGLAADLGLSTEALSETIRVATLGDIDANLAKFNAGDRLIPIRVELDREARSRLDVLKGLRVPTAKGSVPLSAVADFVVGQGPTAISRYDRARRVTVEADLAGNHPLGEGIAAVMALPTAKNLPKGVSFRQSGDAEIMAEVFSGFALAIGAGLMMVYGVLILLFGSFTQPITILFSLPLSVGGAILALLVTGNPISMPVVIGILMLMGIVTKNAIMLVDFAVEEIRRGTPRREALVEAGRKRARPIVMTTIAMVAGMVPSAFAFGDGGEFRAPMAIAVIGGLIVSTVLSLVFVPAVFTVLDDAGRLLGRLFGRFVGAADEPEAAVAGPQALRRPDYPQAAE